jgi:hypothetical protein
MDDKKTVKFAYNAKSGEYDLIVCDKCGAYVAPQSYKQHLKTAKHLRKPSGVRRSAQSCPIQVTHGPVTVSF